MDIYPSVWGSIINFSNILIAELKSVHPEGELELIDWESHANIMELPNNDLLGPTALTITEHSAQILEVNFSIAMSTYSTDSNLFRHRDYLSKTFELLRPGKQLKIYDSVTALPQGYMIFTDGTLLAPMSRAETRPWQYVQASALLEPVLT